MRSNTGSRVQDLRFSCRPLARLRSPCPEVPADESGRAGLSRHGPSRAFIFERPIRGPRTCCEGYRRRAWTWTKSHKPAARQASCELNASSDHRNLVDARFSRKRKLWHRDMWGVSSVAITVLFAAAGIVQTYAQQCITPPPGLVSWWRAEGDASDSFGSNDGTIVGGLTFVSGEVGQAFNLDGNSAYIQVPDSPSLNPTNQLTVEVWYRPVSFAGSGNSPLVDKGYRSHTPPYYQYHLGVTGDHYDPTTRASFTFQVGVGNSANTVSNFWTAGNWYHLVGTYDGAAVKLYVNGQLADMQPASGSLVDYGKDLFIGRFGNLPTFAPGTIDEVSLYNRALSSNEVASLYAVGSAGKCPGFVIRSIALDKGSVGITFRGQAGSYYVLHAASSLSSNSPVTAASLGTYGPQVFPSPVGGNAMFFRVEQIPLTSTNSVLGDPIPDAWKLQHGLSILDPTVVNQLAPGDTRTWYQIYTNDLVLAQLPLAYFSQASSTISADATNISVQVDFSKAFSGRFSYIVGGTAISVSTGGKGDYKTLPGFVDATNTTGISIPVELVSSPFVSEPRVLFLMLSATNTYIPPYRLISNLVHEIQIVPDAAGTFVGALGL